MTSSRSASTPVTSSSSCRREQPAVGAELEHVVLDLARDPGDHLEALGDHGHVAHGDEVLDLQGGERAGDLVEAHLVALEGGQRLVRAGEDLARALEHVAGLADVRRDDLHGLRHRDHREAGLPGDPVRGAVPGAGLLRGDGVVGHQVHRGAVDAGEVLVDDDAAVHLGQLAQAGGGERHVEGEAAGGERLDGLVVAHHDQGAGAAAQDALETVAHRRARGDRGQRRAQAQRLVRAVGAHHGRVPFVATRRACCRARQSRGRRGPRCADLDQPQQLQGGGDVGDVEHPHAVDGPRLGGPGGLASGLGRHHRDPETQPGRLGDALRQVADPAQLAGQADLAHRHHALRARRCRWWPRPARPRPRGRWPARAGGPRRRWRRTRRGRAAGCRSAAAARRGPSRPASRRAPRWCAAGARRRGRDQAPAPRPAAAGGPPS